MKLLNSELPQRLSSVLRGFKAALTPSETAWQGAVKGLWTLVALTTLAVLVGDVLPDFAFGKLAGFLIAVTSLLVLGLLTRLVLGLLSLLSQRYRASLFLLLPLLLMLLAGTGPKGMGLLAVAFIFIATTVGAGVAVLKRHGFKPREQRVTLTMLGVGLALLIGGLVALTLPQEAPNSFLVDFHLEDRTLDLPNPGESGTYGVRTLTYGTGKDLRRPEYGAAVDLPSRSVDGSKLIDNWEGPGGWLRTRYWGFDETELPLQGRVWYPEGDGPFPLVLVVHGNHGMESFSDPGYAYLGELLASRGFLFVSVDENFLNGSFANLANMLGPGLEEENDARGWLLLEHLAQWTEWNADPEHFFSGRVDMDQIALIGHSRGGEAAAIAAAFNDLDRYPDDATLAFDYGFNLRGVIAIAPSDGQYEPRDRGTPLRDINYFVIHGSQDGDVTTFMGSSQYSRTSLTRDPYGEDFHFKSSLYVVGANHGQFNTSWGRNDMGGFWGLALDTRPIMEPEEQRQIAQVYFSAFLEVVLRDNSAYLPIFSDARQAAAWLPDTFYLQNHADSRDLVVANFEEDINPVSTTLTGGLFDGENLTRWREEWIQLKWNPLDTHVAVLAWDDEAAEETASFGVRLPEGIAEIGPESRLVFSLSAADEESLPMDWEDEDTKEDDKEAESTESADSELDSDDDEAKPMDWSIVLTDLAGETATLRLSHDRLLYPLVQAPTRRASFLEFPGTQEVVFHRFSFPLTDFVENNPAFDPEQLHQIRFVFDADPSGVVLLDDLGFADLAHREEPPPNLDLVTQP